MDRRGRRVNHTSSEDLRKYYQLEGMLVLKVGVCYVYNHIGAHNGEWGGGEKEEGERRRRGRGEEEEEGGRGRGGEEEGGEEEERRRRGERRWSGGGGAQQFLFLSVIDRTIHVH